MTGPFLDIDDEQSAVGTILTATTTMRAAFVLFAFVLCFALGCAAAVPGKKLSESQICEKDCVYNLGYDLTGWELKQCRQHCYEYCNDKTGAQQKSPNNNA